MGRHTPARESFRPAGKWCCFEEENKVLAGPPPPMEVWVPGGGGPACGPLNLAGAPTPPRAASRVGREAARPCPRITDWRRKLESAAGAVLATEIKNNACTLAKYTVRAILPGGQPQAPVE